VGVVLALRLESVLQVFTAMVAAVLLVLGALGLSAMAAQVLQTVAVLGVDLRVEPTPQDLEMALWLRQRT
jgi:hypothetical protein